MHFPKIAIVICSFVATALATLAADNPDQAAARAALVAKLFDISAESTNGVKAATPAISTQNSVPVFSTTTVVKPSVNVDNTVMHPINQSGVPGTVSLPGTENSANFHTLTTPSLNIQNPPMNSTRTGMSTSYAATDKPAKKKHKVDQKTYTTTKPAPAPAPAPIVVKSSSEFAPIVAPASPINASKQQKLLDLLAKYKADQITPEEYHRQRAVIMNGM